MYFIRIGIMGREDVLSSPVVEGVYVFSPGIGNRLIRQLKDSLASVTVVSTILRQQVPSKQAKT
jgi:hypothetical protein